MDRWLHKSDSKKYNDLDQIQTITSQEDPDGDGNRQEMNVRRLRTRTHHLHHHLTTPIQNKVQPNDRHERC
ncbi:uncharacterized protein isoform X4 [Leptinotarsa decemlineata]|uniref:uncharacterized protein isoform X4 n=1 Tax=Leptinotarsa decemlineata TaxID=7539 RepID=UPI003D304C55